MRHLHRMTGLLCGLAILFGVHSAYAQAAPAPAAAAGYAGTAECMTCHEKDLAHFRNTGHWKVFFQQPTTAVERLGCEGCHGPGKAHAESGGDERGGLIAFVKKPAPAEVRNKVCLQCHENSGRMLWDGSAHEGRNVACTDCHSIKQDVSERSNLKKATVLATCGQCHAKEKSAALRFSHMPLGENKIECTSCHNPHGTANPKLLIASSPNETCYGCHAEKRGPFLWQHAPVVENCGNCHDPHGSSREKMLKVSRPRLCQQCHEGTGHPQQPRGVTTPGGATPLPSDLQFLLNRACMNCHFNIHGSNHPSGQFFTR